MTTARTRSSDIAVVSGGDGDTGHAAFATMQTNAIFSVLLRDYELQARPAQVRHRRRGRSG